VRGLRSTAGPAWLAIGALSVASCASVWGFADLQVGDGGAGGDASVDGAGSSSGSSGGSSGSSGSSGGSDAARDATPDGGPGCEAEGFDDAGPGQLSTEGDGGITYPSTGCHDGPACAQIVATALPGTGFRYDFSHPLASAGVDFWLFAATWVQGYASVEIHLVCQNTDDYFVDVYSTTSGYYWARGVNLGTFNQGVPGLAPSAWTKMRLLLDGTGVIRLFESGVDVFDFPMAAMVNCGTGVQAVEVYASAVPGNDMVVRLDTLRAGGPSCL
jgi:hypothetical protein